MPIAFSRSSLQTSALFLGLGMLFTHELDAMSNHEWRVLPLLSRLPDSTGQLVFLYAHIPLFAVLVALVASNDTAVRQRARWGISAFLVLHGILHLFFSDHPHYEFAGASSNILIFGGAGFGAAYLALTHFSKQRGTPGQ